MRRINVILAVVSLLAAGVTLAAADLAFKQEVKIPFGMKFQDTTLEAGKYVVRVTTESGRWKLTLARAKESTKEIASLFGDYREIPKEEQTFKKDYRLQILRLTEADGSKTVVFHFDMRNPGPKYNRVVFQVPSE